ncbi:MAG: glycosyl hydrolase 115 family protein [Prevotella sp.]|nr:glycosyl hydrolase 115 family protein [Prevotella sp.]
MMLTFQKVCRITTTGLLLFLSMTGMAASRFVNFTSGDVLLTNSVVTINYDTSDAKAVAIAVEALSKDIERVTGSLAVVSKTSDAKIVVGTIGKSSLIDQLVKQKKLDASLLKGKREKFIITLIDGQLVIAGSDRRGTVYGIYELSEQMGVSPWYYWADVPVAHHDHIYINKGIYTDGEPAVEFRGIFLNDEAPCLTSWVKNTFGTDYGDHRFYEKVFELILRLRGNMMWPAMWMWAFYADDPLNLKTADDMGIIMGTSHHEPMARNHQEYARHRQEWGAWNYQKNQQKLDQFFREGIERMKGTEDMVTIGMRGDGDEAMSEEADTKLLQRVVENQRRIISQVTGKKAKETTQVWALYKEVLDYYDKGMRVPDDVIMLLCDDNWGNVRRVPNMKERQHPGGWGLYYHVDYVGAPRNTKWLNVTPTQNMWEQLHLAYVNGIGRMWILNVGDLKPMEYPITFFMDMAWNPNQYDSQHIVDHTVAFCQQQFGDGQAQEAARLLNLSCKMNGRITAEMLDATTYNVHTGEWRQVADDFMRLEAEALRQYLTLDERYHDAYQQLILFPIQAMSNIYQMYYAQAMNQRLYAEGNPDCNLWADRVEQAFRRDSILCADYNHKIAHGKWNGMMTQKHIGYTSWNDDFSADQMPMVKRMTGGSTGGFVFTMTNKVVSMEAEHYFEEQSNAKTTWTVIPDMGRTRSGVVLMPYTEDFTGGRLSYRFKTVDAPQGKVKVHVVVKSTLDYLNKGGLTYQVSLDGSEPVTVNFNKNLNEDKENIYSVYYPTVARRVVDSVVELPISGGDVHTLTLCPNDPAIVFEKIVVDAGGYQPSYLFMDESPCRIDAGQK